MARVVKIERYYPSVLYNAREMIDIANAENPEFNLLHNLAEKWFKNGFVLDLDADGATRWEEMLGLTVKLSDLEERRQRILARIRALLPYTHRWLANILDFMYGDGNTGLIFNYNAYELRINMAYDIQEYIHDIRRYARVVIPSNLDLIIQNTKSVPQQIYVGAYIRRLRKYKINAGGI
ncbi:MAG: putative phage tail protein [Sporomusa sp.]